MSNLQEKVPSTLTSEDIKRDTSVERPINAYKDSNKTWRSYIWSTLDVPQEEARFLTKLDLTLISAAALGVMCRYLDQVNITNAFNSGMKEDLSLYGKELNYANAIWSAAYVIGQIPSNLLLTRVNVPIYIASLELLWTIFTFAHAGVHNTTQLYFFRFFVGLFEAGHFPAVMYVCSSYYRPHELARRNTIIQIATGVGPLFSGFLMAAVYAGLDGTAGLAGWRWMYIVCGCISFPCAIWTAFAIPQLPARAKKNWIFTQEEVEIARARMPTEKKPLTGLCKWEDIKRWHTTWHTFLFPLLFAFMSQFGQSGGSMIFWVKSYNVKGRPSVFSVPQINLIPLGINIVTIGCTLINSWVSDSLPGSLRWPGMFFASTMAVIFPIALAATPVHPTHRGKRWALYYLTSLTGTAAGITWTWVNEVNRHDPEKRAYVSALMNAFAYIFTAWLPIFTFPANKQPYIVAGNYVTAGFGVAAAGTILLMRHLHNRDLARQKSQLRLTSGDSSGDAAS
ncbi:major facilitator superfamily transporter [Microthyrium microscopicum]|uniref:Major facilitator superfamily transporter n=1 Tax=Microthyrium microscopicum TaxID=703497 RepID=A0A6A6UDX5_9PEZI|nr:major facilitator superfamily transporter [Microthyrium microscopicum]